MRALPTLCSGSHGEKGRRPTMEDAHVTIDDLWAFCTEPTPPEGRPSCAFYGVYDGHGGKRASAFVAAHLHQALVLRLQQLSPSELYDGPVVTGCLREAFAETERAWGERAAARDFQDGTTAVTALVLDDRVYVANLGDSRLIIGGPGGRVRFFTQDHSPSVPSEAKRIRAAGGYVTKGMGIPRVNGDLALSRAFGDVEYKAPGPNGEPVISPVPDITEHPLTHDDLFMVLACDGLWDVYPNPKVVGLVGNSLRSGTPVPRLTVNLVRGAIKEFGQQDNVTAVVVTFWPAAAAPGAHDTSSPKKRSSPRALRASPLHQPSHGSPDLKRSSPRASPKKTPKSSPSNPRDPSASPPAPEGLAPSHAPAAAAPRTCAPPPGSVVIDAVTVVPLLQAFPSANTHSATPLEAGGPPSPVGVSRPTALGPRLLSCAPPPGSVVTEGVTVVA